MDANQPAKPPSSRLPLIIIGLILACLCLAGLGVAGGAFYYFNASAIQRGRIPILNLFNPRASGSASDVGIVMDIPDAGKNHVLPGTPVTYTSNPPSSGPHYDQPLAAGFYDNTVADGHIVHSLEHGYVVIWYNCDGLNGEACDTLKSQIEDIVNKWGMYKIIGMNRTGNMPHLIALTSWGKLAYLDEFDEDFIDNFYTTYLEHAPENSGR